MRPWQVELDRVKSKARCGGEASPPSSRHRASRPAVVPETASDLQLVELTGLSSNHDFRSMLALLEHSDE
jgi:hypothetical protein